MPIQVIAVTADPAERPAYFLGYRAGLAESEALWTRDPWRARWLEEDEAEVEAWLLAGLFPSWIVMTMPLALLGTIEGG